MQRPVMLLAMLTLVLLISLAPAAGWEQAQGEPWNDSFRVSWRPGVLPSTIEGDVDNASPFRAIDVRLQIEGFDAANNYLGERLVWVSSDITPGGSASYFADSIPGAVTYRVSVVSFELVSDGRRPATLKGPATNTAPVTSQGRELFERRGHDEDVPPAPAAHRPVPRLRDVLRVGIGRCPACGSRMWASMAPFLYRRYQS